MQVNRKWLQISLSPQTHSPLQTFPILFKKYFNRQYPVTISVSWCIMFILEAAIKYGAIEPKDHHPMV